VCKATRPQWSPFNPLSVVGEENTYLRVFVQKEFLEGRVDWFIPQMCSQAGGEKCLVYQSMGLRLADGLSCSFCHHELITVNQQENAQSKTVKNGKVS